MRLLPDCLNAVKYRAFWESTDDPSLKKFLDFRLSAGDLEDMKTEYYRYSKELGTISKFYAEVSEHGREVISGNDRVSVGELYSTNHFETLCIVEYTSYSTTRALVVGTTACLLSDKKSAIIRRFWKLQVERQNIIGKVKLHEDRVDARVKKTVQDLQASQHITIADVATKQIKHYARSTTTSITKRFLDCKERKVKRTKTHEDSNGNDIENNPFLVSDEKLSTDSPNDIADNNYYIKI
ncbi:8837_t:CDS:2 [Ambispora leptoticha]|uniref:8837_t:CDS:1 n=1 Tax=Ambispora leptoticha TaxID=144679 RepID=A0A9N9C8R2_9GLOM|nr:8837_t:CDS:2 [Ambispora leptoticha]